MIQPEVGPEPKALSFPSLLSVGQFSTYSVTSCLPTYVYVRVRGLDHRVRYTGCAPRYRDRIRDGSLEKTRTHTRTHALSRSRAVIHTVERRETRPNQRCPLEDRSISISGEPVDVHSVCL